tara:strand:- start:4464 stop:5387 length:924 start_codon:yes stop_codon:yes gene_type:complete
MSVKDLRDRDNPQFFDVWQLDWEKGNENNSAKLFHDLDVRVMSERKEDGQGTYMVQAPAGWSHIEQADEGTLELFLLEGDLTVNGQTVGAGGYVAVPQDCGAAELTTTRGFKGYAFWDSKWVKDYYYDNQIYVAKVWEVDWILTEMPGLRHGIMHKSLRWPDPTEGLHHGGPGGMLRFIHMAPGFGEPRQEVHWDCWEEMVWLAGDLMMPERGMHAAGSFLANPPGLAHGPLLTAKGSLLMLHCDAPMGAEFNDLFDSEGNEIGTEIRRTFHDGTSWLEAPKHSDWEDCPEYDLYPNSEPHYVEREN